MAEAAAADPHHPGIPVLQMVDASEKRALAGAAGPEQRNDLADPHGQIEPVEDGLATVILAQIAHLDGDIVAFDHGGVFCAIEARGRAPRWRRQPAWRRILGSSARYRGLLGSRHGARHVSATP